MKVLRESAVKQAESPELGPASLPPAPGNWHHPPRDLVGLRTRLGYGLAYGIAAICACFVASLYVIWAVKSQLELGQDLTSLFALALFPLLAAEVAGQVLREASLKVTPEDIALMDEERGLDLLVQVSVVVNGRVIAKDRGILGFASEAMYFSGHSFSFLVGSQDLAPRRKLWLLLIAPHLRQIGLKHSASRVTLRLAVLRGADWNWHEKMRFLKGALTALKRYKPTPLPRQYPPLEGWSRRDDG